MFGFYGFLPFSTLDTIYYNTKETDIILSIQRSDVNLRNVISIVAMDLTLQKDNQIII